MAIIYWKIDNGTLYIRGDAAQNYSEADMVNKPAASSWPWHNNRSDIINVVIETDISLSSMQNCFSQCINLVSFTIQPSCSINGLSSMQNCFNDCTSFNQPITIPSSVTNMGYCFEGCTSFNSQVTFESSSRVTNMGYCFYGCTSFNQPITIPSSVTTMSYCFAYSRNFNSQVTFQTPNSVTNMSYCFYYCTSFNQPIIIPSSVTDMSCCFRSCTALNNNVVCFNYPTSSYSNIFNATTKQITVTLIGDIACNRYSDWITIIHDYSNVGFGPPTFNVQFELDDYRYTYMYSSGNISFNIKVIDKTKTTYSAINSTIKMNNEYRYVTSMSSCFQDCTSFNQAITIPSSVDDMYSCFQGCTSLNQPITIPNSVTDMSYCFCGCTSFNQSIIIPNSVTGMRNCFYECTSFNSQVTFQSPSMVIDLYHCFENCTSFNQPIIIPSSVINTRCCFYGCTSFNSQVTFQDPSSVTDMNSCFWGCTSFNQEIIIPSSATSMYCCFEGCTSFNQSISIPSSTTDIRYCFRGCTALNSLITINSNVSSYNDVFRETSRVIPITGVSNKLQNIASSYDNVYVYSLQCTNIGAERDDDIPTNVELEIVVSRFIADSGEISIDVYTDNIPVDNLVWNPSSLIMDNLTKKFTTTLIVDESSSHEISVQIRDVWGESSVRTISVSTVYYTIDFLHGGKGVSFGEKAITDDMYFPLQGVIPFEADKYYSRGVVVSSGEHKFDKIHTKPDDWDEKPEDYYTLENPGGLFKNDMNSLFKRKLDLYEDGSPDGEERGYVDSILTEMLETRGWNDCISYVDGSGMISTLHVREILKNLLDMSLVGEIKAYAGTNIPRGWLDCDGRLVNISDYPYLFSVIGDTWGTPTATQFYLPDLRGRTLIGSQSGTYSVGGTGGSPYIQAHTHTDTFTLPNHTHPTGGTASDGTDRFLTAGSGDGWGIGRRIIKNGTGTELGGNFYNTSHGITRKANTGNPNSNPSIAGAVGGVNNTSTGTSGNYPPYKVVRYIIKY